jgi:hypothetical protein
MDMLERAVVWFAGSVNGNVRSIVANNYKKSEEPLLTSRSGIAADGHTPRHQLRGLYNFVNLDVAESTAYVRATENEMPGSRSGRVSANKMQKKS